MDSLGLMIKEGLKPRLGGFVCLLVTERQGGYGSRKELWATASMPAGVCLDVNSETLVLRSQNQLSEVTKNNLKYSIILAAFI